MPSLRARGRAGSRAATRAPTTLRRLAVVLAVAWPLAAARGEPGPPSGAREPGKAQPAADRSAAAPPARASGDATPPRTPRGPLRRNPENPRYFSDDAGRPVYLTGSHTWANFLEVKRPGGRDFPNDEWLAMLAQRGHNFMRLWTWVQPAAGPWTDDPVIFEPMPYARTGPGLARDGKPRFDLTRWNDEFFARLRRRVLAAGARGLYVSVMLFEGWCLKWSVPTSDAWGHHPFHRDNNVNGVDGDPNGDGKADVYALESPRVRELQEAYVRKVIDAVGDLDHVLWEIANETENSERAFAWQEHMIRFVREVERGRPKQHPIGMTAEGGGQHNPVLFASSADWISPGSGPGGEYRFNPPAADGTKVILADTDHLWGHGVTVPWVWKSFLRGLNPLFMDPWWPVPGRARVNYAADALNVRDRPIYEAARIALGQTRRFAERLDLNRALPRPAFASSGYCLANPGVEYLVYVPDEDRVSVYLGIDAKDYDVEWFDTRTGATRADAPIRGGGNRQLISPFGLESVVYLRARR